MKKWYQTSAAAVILLILFFPVGLFLMWKYTHWNKIAKWIITGFFAVLVVVSIFAQPEPAPVPANASSSPQVTSSRDEVSSTVSETVSQQAASEPSPASVVPSSEASSPTPAPSSHAPSDLPSDSTPPVQANESNDVLPRASSQAQAAPPQNEADYTPSPSNGTVVINPEENKQPAVSYVWITKTGNKYHSIPNCGNTKTATEIPLDSAIAMGYTACKRCH